MLQGVRVIDFSQYLPGPYATLRLADLGAEVIKVESPSGDPVRMPREEDQGDRYLFRSVNRNKKGLVIDLKDKNGQLEAHKLIAQADVVVECFRPGVADRLGIGYQEAVKLKPDIVYCSLSGYGQHGAMSQLGSHDINYMSLSGVLGLIKDDQGKPVPPHFPFADFVGGITASEAIVSALFQRGRTGEGTYLDISLVDSLTSIMTAHLFIDSAGTAPGGYPRISRNMIAYFIYRTKDDRYVSMGASEFKFWQNFCIAVGKEEWLKAHNTPPNETNPVYKEVCEMFASRTLNEWMKFSLEMDCCMTPILEVSEVREHPYHRERKLIQEQQGYTYVNSIPYLKDEAWLKYLRPSPKLNEHAQDIKF